MNLKFAIRKILNDVNKAEQTKVAEIKQLVEPLVADIVGHPVIVASIAFAVGLLVGHFA